MSNNSINRLWFTMSVVMALACFVIPARAQLTMERKTSTCTAADKLEVTSFTITPTQPASGQSVKVVMKIKNKCPSGTANLNVPWIIKRDSTQISSGTVTLAPGATSSDLIGNWTAASGTFNFWGAADPQKTISETERNNNTTNDYRITVGTSSSSTTSTAVLETQLLNYQKAKAAGARFSDSVEGVSTCRIAQCDWSSYCGIAGGAIPSSGTGVLFRATCQGLSSGGRGNPEAFINFTLKNGWKVKSVEVIEVRKRYGDWGWETRPSVGNINPYMKMHLWADTDGDVAVNVKVWIEGPQGTDPYQ